MTGSPIKLKIKLYMKVKVKKNLQANEPNTWVARLLPLSPWEVTVSGHSHAHRGNEQRWYSK